MIYWLANLAININKTSTTSKLAHNYKSCVPIKLPPFKLRIRNQRTHFIEAFLW